MKRHLAAFVLVVTGLGLVGVSGAGAATIADAGWWDRDSGALVPKLDPPDEDELRVANDPTGASAVLAVRYQLDEGEERPRLVLRVAGEPAAETVSMVACPATEPWEGADGGPLDEAPGADCEIGAALGLVSADGTTISFDLASVTQESVVDVVIAPAPTGDNPVDDTFTVDFEAPTSADLVTQAALAPPPPVPTAPAPGSGSSGSPAPAAGGSTAGSSFGSPSASPGATPSAPVGGDFSAGGTPDATAAPTDAASSGATAGPPLEPSGSVESAAPIASEASGGRQAVALAVALAIVALGAYLWRADRSRAVLAAGPTMGGLGPFVRERSGPAPDVA